MGFYDAFFGSDQSQYTAYAIVAAIIAICITILLTATDIPISNRLLIVFFVIISLIPSVFLTLFELTCIVTGGTEPNKWWCYAFAWVLAAFIIIYCIFIVIISLISLFTYNNAIDNVSETENKTRLSPEVSNDYAKQIIATNEHQTKQIEKFYNDSMAEMLKETEKKESQNLSPATSMSSMASISSIIGQQQEQPQQPQQMQQMQQMQQPEQPQQQQPQQQPEQQSSISQFTNNKIPHISSFTDMKKSITAAFSNYGGNSSEEDFSDGFFSYDKFAAN
jgi:uncharacterized membrane protein